MTTQTEPPSSTDAGAGEGPELQVHLARSRDELRDVMRDSLRAMLAGRQFALLVHDQELRLSVELLDCDTTDPQAPELGYDSWDSTTGVTLPLIWSDREIGCLVLGEEPPPEQRTQLEHVLRHYAAALVNLELKEESTQATDYYCASLRAFEEGVVLFQEQNPEAIGARFLDLCTGVLQATAGAVYVLEKAGNLRSKLRLDHAWGLPEETLDCLLLEEGGWWPKTLVGGQFTFLSRDGTTGEFDRLRNDRIPGPLTNLVGAPLRYHGVDVGVCLLFNIPSDKAVLQKLESVQRLFDLGAAVFHRRQLEAEAMRNKQLQTQLEIAATLQKRLLPRQGPAHPRFEFAWSSQAAQLVGGDYLDLLDLEDGTVFGVIADVAGHGINSALLMTSFRASCRAESRLHEPHELLARLNETVRGEVGETGMFLTVAALHLHHDGRHLSFASAGHNPAFLYRLREDRFEILDSSGPPLGFFANTTYELATHTAEPGDVLVLYTDGIVEATDPSGQEMFETARLQALIRDHASAGPETLRMAILQAINSFCGGKAHEDDISLLAIRFR